MRWRRLAVLACLASSACGPRAGSGRTALLDRPTAQGVVARAGSLAPAGETRPALLESAAWRVRLPRRALLTFGMGVAWAGEGEAPGWYRLTVEPTSEVLAERTLNPRALRGWRDVSVPVPSAPARRTLAFDLRLTDRDGAAHRPARRPAARRRRPDRARPRRLRPREGRRARLDRHAAARPRRRLRLRRPTTPRARRAGPRAASWRDDACQHVVVDAARAPVDADLGRPGRARRRRHAARLQPPRAHAAARCCARRASPRRP